MKVEYHIGILEASAHEGSTLDEKNVIIESEYRGFSVRSIDYTAFIGNHIIRTLYIPASIILMDFHAFDNCDYLESVNLPDTFIRINSSCFEGDTRLSHIDVRMKGSDDWLGTVISMFDTFDGGIVYI